MSKVIAIRAWHTKENKFVKPGYYAEISAGGVIKVLDKNVILHESTGLKDKNGKTIFEWDIVKWDDCSDGKYWRVAIVSLEPDLRFKCFDCPLIENSSAHGHTFKFGSFIYTDTHNHLHVIGNIHSNPELLEKN